MRADKLRRLVDAIGGRIVARVPRGSGGAASAGLAAFYQARRRASQSQGQGRDARPIDPHPAETPQTSQGPATVSG